MSREKEGKTKEKKNLAQAENMRNNKEEGVGPNIDM